VQAQCPQCSQRIVIDDAKVPERAFNVKCPKCQSVVRLQGRAGGAAPPSARPEPASEPAEVPQTLPTYTPPPGEPHGHAANAEDLRAQVMAQLRREMGMSGEAGRRALVALPDRNLAGAITLPLTRLGYSVDTLDDWEEGARLLEQGAYSVVATARVAAAQGRPESLYQRVHRLSPENRRQVCMIVVGDEFKTGDGTQAFAVLADLVVNSRDASAIDGLLNTTLGERARLYQALLDARRRWEAASS
jgi:predicted Zn finger-like uncharacterized protein